MKSLIATLKQNYDLIVIDSPPSGPVIDPVIVSHLCDKILCVVRWGATPRELVAQSVSLLSGNKKIAGVAFNMVNEKQARKYGRNASAYYYGSRYYKNYYVE
jgi:Mrp family chromosome partitioning ATPase